MRVAGLDIGFGFTKATNGEDCIVYKSILGEAVDIKFRMNIGKGDNDYCMHVILEGNPYFVGDYAEQQSNVRHFTLDQEQLIAEFARVLSLTALGHLIPTHVPFNLITGLPVGFYQEYSQRLARTLQGDHEIMFQSPDGSTKVHKIVINRIRIIPQPLGSVFNMLIDEQGGITSRDLAKQKIGVIDIGFRTTDFCIFDHLQYVERGSTTTETGISRSFNIISKKLREESKVNVELFRLYNAIQKGSIKIRGKEYNTARIRDVVYSHAAATIAGDAERLWADEWDMDAVLITGGGAVELAKFLKPLISGNVFSIDSNTDARLNNVKGYHKYAMYLWGGQGPKSQSKTDE